MAIYVNRNPFLTSLAQTQEVDGASERSTPRSKVSKTDVRSPTDSDCSGFADGEFHLPTGGTIHFPSHILEQIFADEELGIAEEFEALDLPNQFHQEETNFVGPSVKGQQEEKNVEIPVRVDIPPVVVTRNPEVQVDQTVSDGDETMKGEFGLKETFEDPGYDMESDDSSFEFESDSDSDSEEEMEDRDPTPTPESVAEAEKKFFSDEEVPDDDGVAEMGEQHEEYEEHVQEEEKIDEVEQSVENEEEEVELVKKVEKHIGELPTEIGNYFQKLMVEVKELRERVYELELDVQTLNEEMSTRKEYEVEIKDALTNFADVVHNFKEEWLSPQ